MTRVFPFGEGHTEEVVFKVLMNKFFPDQALHVFKPVGGKRQFLSRIEETVKSEILPNRKINILVFRDIDGDERIDSVRASIHNIVTKLLSKWQLRPGIHQHQKYPNIYIWDQPPTDSAPGLRLVLHLANISTANLALQLRNQTTDGYVLAAGLDSIVLDRFAQHSKVNSNAQALNMLITQSIPERFASPGITFDEDKDYLAAYLCATRFWVTKRTEDQAHLVNVILDRAWKYNQQLFESLFTTWRVAIEEAIQ